MIAKDSTNKPFVHRYNITFTLKDNPLFKDQLTDNTLFTIDDKVIGVDRFGQPGQYYKLRSLLEPNAIKLQLRLRGLDDYHYIEDL